MSEFVYTYLTAWTDPWRYRCVTLACFFSLSITSNIALEMIQSLLIIKTKLAELIKATVYMVLHFQIYIFRRPPTPRNYYILDIRDEMGEKDNILLPSNLTEAFQRGKDTPVPGVLHPEMCAISYWKIPRVIWELNFSTGAQGAIWSTFTSKEDRWNLIVMCLPGDLWSQKVSMPWNWNYGWFWATM